MLYSSNMEHEKHPHVTHHATHHPSSNEIHPKKKDDLSIPLAIIFAGVLVAGAIIFSDNTHPALALKGPSVPDRQAVGADSSDAPVAELALRPGDHVLGNPDADVLIIEYSDTECPFCKKFNETMTAVMEQYGKTGTVAWVYRYFPLDQIHPKSRKEAEALECANELGGNDAFWKYVDKIFEITPANNGLDPGELPVIANTIGLDVARFNACLSSGKYADRIQKDFESGVNIGVRGTPYTVAWNRKTGKQVPIEGALPLGNVKSILGIVTASKAAP